MTSAEFRERIKLVYPAAASGDLSAVEELRELVMRKRGPRFCECGCGKPLPFGRKRYATKMCHNIKRRKAAPPIRLHAKNYNQREYNTAILAAL